MWGTDRRTRTNYRDVLLLGGAKVVERVERVDLTQIDNTQTHGSYFATRWKETVTDVGMWYEPTYYWPIHGGKEV
jgi:hypothetical protein